MQAMRMDGPQMLNLLATVKTFGDAVSPPGCYWPVAGFMFVWKMAIHFPFSCFHTVPAL